jgi:hypothetical protein
MKVRRNEQNKTETMNSHKDLENGLVFMPHFPDRVTLCDKEEEEGKEAKMLDKGKQAGETSKQRTRTDSSLLIFFGFDFHQLVFFLMDILNLFLKNSTELFGEIIQERHPSCLSKEAQHSRRGQRRSETQKHLRK